MGFTIELTDEQWSRVAGLFDPPGRRGSPARIPRRQMVNAMLFLARMGCQWRYLPNQRAAPSPAFARAPYPCVNASQLRDR
ncbi:MAG: transposase [Chloroflexi bacterium]|nr:transposase [Chloroflexota bacterium]